MYKDRLESWEALLVTETPKPRGNPDNIVRLNEDQIFEIQQLYAKGTLSQKAIAEIYKCSVTVVFRAVNYRTKKSMGRKPKSELD